MSDSRQRRPIDAWKGYNVDFGQSVDIHLDVSESSSGQTIQIPLQVRRGAEDGPVVFVTAALHGDEINGTGAIRALLRDPELLLLRGSVILVPVLNILAFDRHSRYLPDRRDLNRCFPGSAKGSLAGRMARSIFDEIVARADFGIDLHTAAVRRTNYPTVRGNMADKNVGALARSFGSEVIIDKEGPKGALRKEACKSGCPTIIMEGGEVWKVEPAIVASSVRGVKNVLQHLDMIDGDPTTPDYQVVVKKTKWIRAENGGFLRFHISPGEIIEKGQPLTTNTDLLGNELQVLYAPFDAVVIGITTLPAVSPGEPICHLAELPATMRVADLQKMRDDEHGLEERLVEDLASSLVVVERDRDEEE